MIKINIPDNNTNERSYIIDIILGEFLGLKYEIFINPSLNDYEIVLKNSKKLIIKDGFFSKFKGDLSYLKQESLPKNIKFAKNDFLSKKDIPIIFGDETIQISENEIICEIDIFASCFFMLTRWEEYVNKRRDIYDRFAAKESLAFKFGFLNRAVVDEYSDFLYNLLAKLGLNLEKKQSKFRLFLTHDIDDIHFFKNIKQIFRLSLGDFIKRKSLKLALSRYKDWFLIKQEKMKDPYDTFDFLMDKSEELGVKSEFYFLSGGVTKYENNFKIKSNKAQKIIENIKKRDHIIGLHPSFNSYNDGKMFKSEKQALEKVANLQVTNGRQHYLRFEVPTTWQIWEDNGMQLDSTCGYADKEGYRCGTGNEFSVFNILTRLKLKLKERPLLYMDVNRYDENLSENEIETILSQIIHSNQNVTILFHNSIFCQKDKDYKGIYEKVIKNAFARKNN